MNAAEEGPPAGQTAGLGDGAPDAREAPTLDAAQAAAATASEPVTAVPEPQEASSPPPTAEALERLASEVAAIARRINELVRLGDRREELIDRLHADNQRLRAGELAQVQAPVLRELIRSYDLIVTLVREGSPVGSDLELVRRRLLDGLEQSGVRPLGAESGAPFDAALHAAVERVVTADPALDMTVARTVRVGFVQDGERILRPADVAVSRCDVRGAASAGSAEQVPEAGMTTRGEE